MTFMLILDVGQQGHQPGPLDGQGQLALVERAGPGDPARRDLAAVRDVLLQDLDGLVVDAPDVPLAEPAEFPLGGEILAVAAAFAALGAVGSVVARHVTSPLSLRPERERRPGSGPERPLRRASSSSAGRGPAGP